MVLRERLGEFVAVATRSATTCVEIEPSVGPVPWVPVPTAPPHCTSEAHTVQEPSVSENEVAQPWNGPIPAGAELVDRRASTVRTRAGVVAPLRVTVKVNPVLPDWPSEREARRRAMDSAPVPDLSSFWMIAPAVAVVMLAPPVGAERVTAKRSLLSTARSAATSWIEVSACEAIAQSAKAAIARHGTGSTPSSRAAKTKGST